MHGYRTLQHWDQWLAQHFLGNSLLREEQKLLERALSRHFGKHALLVGAPHQYPLLSSDRIAYHSLASPLISYHNTQINFIESSLSELPILTGSIDLVILPHTLELVDNPRHLLDEACRIIKPEGIIVIFGFNPYSFWGLKKALTQQKTTPWLGNFIQASKVKEWLQIADFALEAHQGGLFRPPITHPGLYERLQFLEYIGQKGLSAMGGIYMLQARAKVVPLTPIRMKWKQQLNNIRISTTISGHIA